MDNKKQHKGTVVNSNSGGKSKVWFWAPDCKYQVILNNAKKLNWKLVRDERNEHKNNIYWIDVSTIHERFKIIQPWQMINHFPGMVCSFDFMHSIKPINNFMVHIAKYRKKKQDGTESEQDA